jgi:hypothetical protein
MIEFKVAYWEQAPYHDLIELSVAFSDTGVQVSAMDVAYLTKVGWDQARAHILSRPHGDWGGGYGGTPLRELVDSERLEAATMMAFGALHVLAPSCAEAALLEASPGAIAGRFNGRILADGMGNEIRVMPPVAADAETVDELMMKGQLQKLTVVVTPATGPQFSYAAYFKPFHVPVTAQGDLSEEAVALRAKLP